MLSSTELTSFLYLPHFWDSKHCNIKGFCFCWAGGKKDTQTKHKVKILVFDLLVVSATLTRWQTKQTFQLMLSVSHPEKKNCERTSSCLQCPARTMSCLCVLLSRVALLELALKGCHPWAFVPSRKGRSSVVLWSSACVGGCAQCHVRCHPATHMVSDLALWVCPTTNGNSTARVPVFFRVVPCDRSCQEGSFGLRKPFGVNGLLWYGLFFGVFFVQDMEVLFSDFELRGRGSFSLRKSRATDTSTYSFLTSGFTPAVLRWIASKISALHSPYKSST